MDQAQREKLTQAAILMIAVCLYMAKPWDSLLQAMDSAIHARFALEVSGGGFWPKLPIPNFFPDGEAPYFNDHPYLPFYLVGKFMRAFGANAWGARFLPTLSGVCNVGLIMLLAKKVANYPASIFAAVFLLASPLVLQFTARFQLDPFLITFILLSYYFAADRKFFLAGVASGLAVCFKSPVGWLILPSLFVFEFFSLSFIKCLIPAILLPMMLWISANEISHLPLLQDYFTRQVLGTAVGGRHLSQSADWHTGFEVIRRNLKIPLYLVAILVAYAVRRKNYKLELNNKSALKLTVVGFLIFWLVISLMRFKFPHYYLPGIPLGLIVLASLLPSFSTGKLAWTEYTLWAAAVIMPLALLILPIKTVPESFPALRYFTPLIQSYGSPADAVLFIENEQAYGSAGDYYVETAFYTGHPFYSSQCSEADERVKKFSPTWIITSGATPFACLRKTSPSNYPAIWQFGNQFLLSTIPRQNSAIFDFTPQTRDLKAPVDGKAAALPKDIFYRYLPEKDVN